MAITRSQMKALLARLEKPVRDAFLDAVYTARSFAKIKALMSAIETGDANRIMSAAGIREGMWSGVTEGVRTAYATNGAHVLANELPKTLGLRFDINNPRAEEWLKIYSSTKARELAAEQVSAVQTSLRNSMVKGKNPRSAALDIVGRIDATGRRSGGVIGLTDYQAGLIDNAADDLDELNWQRYKKRKLRDRRWDGVVKRHAKSGKPIPKATKQKIVDRYSDRMLKHRGDTIGRTETLRATNEAGDEAMKQIIDEGIAPRNAVKKIWRHSLSRNERPGHVAMNAREKGIDELFTNPITFAVLKYPGDPQGGPGEIINCRCYIEHKIDFVAVEQAA